MSLYASPSKKRTRFYAASPRPWRAPGRPNVDGPGVAASSSGAWLLLHDQWPPCHRSMIRVVPRLCGQNQSDYDDDMMLSLYFALGIFLLMAARNPSANRSLIAFAAWSSFAHGAVMAVLAFHIASERRDLLIAVAVLCIIGVALIVLSPAKHSGERASVAGA